MPVRLPLGPVVAATVIVLSASPVSAQPVSSLTGDTTYRLYCASCHGPKARGDGPLASSLRRPPTNLTELTKKTGGSFPSDLVAQVIDGRKPVKGHGGGEMPVWGDAFSRSDEVTPIPERIARVVRFLESIQTH